MDINLGKYLQWYWPMSTLSSLETMSHLTMIIIAASNKHQLTKPLLSTRKLIGLIDRPALSLRVPVSSMPSKPIDHQGSVSYRPSISDRTLRSTITG
jgi:hypothetical protein